MEWVNQQREEMREALPSPQKLSTAQTLTPAKEFIAIAGPLAHSSK